MLSLSALQSNRKVSFVIPVRVDSPERAQNLDLVVEQLMALKDSIRMEIRILEADEHPHYELKISDEHIHKTFVRDASPVFHRTKYLNRLMQEAEGAIVGIWDTDVLLPKEQILEAVDAIRKGNAVMSFPYDGRFYMLPQSSRPAGRNKLSDVLSCIWHCGVPHCINHLFRSEFSARRHAQLCQWIKRMKRSIATMP